MADVLGGRLARASAALNRAKRVESRFPWLRLAAFVLFTMAAVMAFGALPSVLAALAALLALAPFVILTFLHRRVLHVIARYEMILALTRDRIARRDLDWQHIAAPYALGVPPEHPFDRDLQISGARSLHALLDTTASDGASRLLGAWLLQDCPDPAAARERQALVRCLRDRPVLRLRLALAGASATLGEDDPHTAIPPRFNAAALTAWLDAPAPAARDLRPLLLALSALALVNIVLIVLWALGILPPWWSALEVLFLLGQSLRRRESAGTFDAALELAARLSRLREVFRLLEGLQACPQDLPGGGRVRRALPELSSVRAMPPKRALRAANRIAAAAALRNNPFLALGLNLFLPWDLFLAWRLARLREGLRPLLPQWLAAWFRLDALCALAEFAALHPAYALPDLPAAGEGAILHAVRLAHPLIPPAQRVGNDFSLHALGELVLVTGSNMAGKSTFLRTLGVNVVLAFAGAPVAAAALSVQPLRVFASMNLSDSLSEGISYFYAEVRRLRALLDALADPAAPPLLYLIDEIFRGTNNRERRAGARGMLNALAGARAVGLVATHDLDLAQLASTINVIRNVHFREEIVADRMSFDYRLHSGVCPTTNALRIMAAAGLPVDVEEPKF